MSRSETQTKTEERFTGFELVISPRNCGGCFLILAADDFSRFYKKTLDLGMKLIYNVMKLGALPVFLSLTLLKVTGDAPKVDT